MRNGCAWGKGFGLVLALLLSAAAPASAIQGFMRVTGAKQGVIAGDSVQPGHVGEIDVVSFASSVSVPLKGKASGAAVQKAIAGPITVVTALDRATPKLFQALATNEVLTSVEIDFERPALAGGQELETFYRIVLTNAQVVELTTTNDGGDASAEQVSLVWQKLKAIDLPSGNQFEFAPSKLQVQ